MPKLLHDYLHRTMTRRWRYMMLRIRRAPMASLLVLFVFVMVSAVSILWWWGPIAPGWAMSTIMSALALSAVLVTVYQFYWARNQARKQRMLRRSLQEQREFMALRVAERTRELADANRQLSTEIRLTGEYTDALRESEQKLQLAMQASQLAVWDWHVAARTFSIEGPDGGFGQSQHGQMLDLRDFVYAEDFPQVRTAIQNHLKGRTAYLIMRYRTQQDPSLWVEDRGRTIAYDAQRRPARILGTRRNITTEVNRERELTLAASLFSGNRDPLLVLDRQFNITAMNPAFADMLRRPATDWVNRPWTSCSHSELIPQITNGLERQGHWEGEILEARADGSAFPLFMNIRSVFTGDHVAHYLCFCRDLSQQPAMIPSSEAHYDPLTGLANRHYFHQHLDYYRRMDHLPAHQLALGILNVDGFRQLNEQYGHSAGDQILQHLAARLNHYGAPLIMAARLGADEFALLFSHYETTQRLKQLCLQIVQDMHRPMMLEQADVLMGVSIGLIELTEHNVHHGFNDARNALQEAKANGGNQVLLGGEALTYSALERATIVQYLQDILTNLNSPLRYVPMYAAPHDEMAIGLRAYTTLTNERAHAFMDEPLFQMARERHLEERLFRQLLAEAIRTAQAVPSYSSEPVMLSYPLNGTTAANDQLATLVMSVADELQFPLHQLEISLAAHHLDTSRFEHIVRQIAVLHSRGVLVSLDCLGTLNLTMDQLSRLPLSTLRVSHAMLQASPLSPQIQLLLATARELGWRLAVTGVVNEPSLRQLHRLGVDSVEGPYFAAPLDSSALLTLLNQVALHDRGDNIHVH